MGIEHQKQQGEAAPDDRIRKVDGAAGRDDGLVPLSGFVLAKVAGYQKPPLAEDLSDPGGGTYGGTCTCNSVCTCVPVQTCACHAVCTCDTVQGCTVCVHSGGGGGGGGYGGYYAPCF
jgi:hypothetical protein